MDEAMQKRLQNRFPMLYRDIGNTETCMRFGLEVGNGWFRLLWKLSEDLENLDPSLVTSQVKEKFGTLRFYLESAELGMRHEAGEMFSFAPQAKDKRVRARISLAEEESAGICQQCGAPGKLRYGCYVHVACDLCEESQKG